MSTGTPVPPPPGPPRLLDRVRHAARLRHMSRRTEETYVGWIRRFILFHGKRHPDEMGAPEVIAFLSDLAVRRHVGATTQNQALSALLFLYRAILGRELEGLDAAARAHASRSLPVVLTRDEVRAVLAQLPEPHRLVATLLYGSGLRLLEGLRLRVKDLDPDRRQIVVRDGKGDRDRRVPFPTRLRESLELHLERVRALHLRDCERGIGPWIPGALGLKYPNAHLEWLWYWVFPAQRPGVDPRTGAQFRNHLHETALQRAVKEAADRACIRKRVTCHTFRHHADSRIMPMLWPGGASTSRIPPASFRLRFVNAA